MTDTQWPRFIVFHQEKAEQPHQYAGSVHAPDAEMALMNARDVFVRRPACVSLWVVPAKAIYSKTAEELMLNPDLVAQTAKSDQLVETYCVFEKRAQKGGNVHISDVSAATPELALKQALEQVADRSALVWWVFPQRSITRSTPEDIEVLFAPAVTKDYREQAHFHTEAMMQKIRSRSQEAE